MEGASCSEEGCSEFVEVDPTGRYGRYSEILGRGATKTVYRAFDEYQGIEVAWNQVKLHDFLRSPEQLERLYGEIHLLKTLKHDNIMKFYTSWVDIRNMNINFVTELFASGTLRQYRLKHRTVNMRAVKHCCKQILRGLVYLHSRDPPVIHRDLKCDNIFINGNQGQVKIGDLGLAAILKKSSAAHCVGTPEFMAPEVYEEEYNELVDIYSFGMCVLEMVTFEYPYSECTHPAQIYKKVVSGKKPEALYRVRDLEVQGFVQKCLATASLRLSARELLKDPFLNIDDSGSDIGIPESNYDFGEVSPVLRHSLYGSPPSGASQMYDYSTYFSYDREYDLDLDANEFDARGLDLFYQEEDECPVPDVDISIKGRRREEDDGIILRLRIADKEGQIRNIYFPFDVEMDTASRVAIEMVSELDMIDQDVEKIADMIDGEIALLVPGWHTNSGTDEIPLDATANVFLSSTDSEAKSQQVLQSSNCRCTAMHSHFEEIMYKVDNSEPTDCSEVSPSTSSRLHYTDIWAERNITAPSPSERGDIQCDVSNNQYPNSVHSNGEQISTGNNELGVRVSEDYENEIREDLRWLKAKFQMQLRELTEDWSPSPVISAPKPDKEVHDASGIRLSARKKCGSVAMGNGSWEAANGSCSPDQMTTARSFYVTSASLHLQTLHRAASLPVDAIDF